MDEVEVQDVEDIGDEMVKLYRSCKSAAVKLDILLALRDMRAQEKIDAPVLTVTDAAVVSHPESVEDAIKPRHGFRIGKHDKVRGNITGQKFETADEFWALRIIKGIQGTYDFLFRDASQLFSMSGGNETLLCALEGNAYLPRAVLIRDKPEPNTGQGA